MKSTRVIGTFSTREALDRAGRLLAESKVAGSVGTVSVDPREDPVAERERVESRLNSLLSSRMPVARQLKFVDSVLNGRHVLVARVPVDVGAYVAWLMEQAGRVDDGRTKLTQLLGKAFDDESARRTVLEYTRDRLTLVAAGLVHGDPVLSDQLDDLVQVANLRLIQAFDKRVKGLVAAGTTARYIAYATKVLKHVVIDLIRSIERQRKVADRLKQAAEPQAESDPDPAGVAVAEFHAEAVAAILALPEPQRTIVFGKLIMGLEFGHLTNVRLKLPSRDSYTNLKQVKETRRIYHRGLKSIRRLLGPRFSIDDGESDG